MMLLLVLGLLSSVIGAQSGHVGLETDFQPTVTGMCQRGYMVIQVRFNQSFVGAVHSRAPSTEYIGRKTDYRKGPCLVNGDGQNNVTLKVSLYAQPGSEEYCGIIVNNKTDERMLAIAVRVHRTLELAEDKYYVITCGSVKYVNPRNETSLVALRLLDYESGKKTSHAYISEEQLYKLRVEISPFDEDYDNFRVKSCLGFDGDYRNVTLVDERGCPDNSKIVTQFTYDRAHGTADATLKPFQFHPDQRALYLQCEIVMCKGECLEYSCDDDEVNGNALAVKGGGKQEQMYASLIAGLKVVILLPGEQPVTQALCDEGFHPPWLLYLAVALGVLLLIMFIINVFLCSAMTCSCARTEIIEKDPSIIDDYDPYRSWHGSQYGSRYSLNGKPGYTSGGSTMNSTRSISTNSDHYAIVHSRPGSRYSGPGHKQHHHHHHRGPSSNLGSHYSGK